MVFLNSEPCGVLLATKLNFEFVTPIDVAFACA
ncbi:hypothetical protein X738_00130 [Mesorhizobium sp. LNHC209A00]|nr:hypothetical protein X738_00130 [Mesorhizobium sp. LNHC209A00]